METICETVPETHETDAVNKIILTKHVLERHRERFPGRLNKEKSDPSREIKRDITKGIFWYGPNDGRFLIVYNKLKAYIAVREGTVLRALTVYPYTKRIKRRLMYIQKVQSPLGSFLGGVNL